MGIKGYDQWKTASPHDDEQAEEILYYDVMEDADRVVNAVDKAMMDWETKPGPWKYHIDEMKRVIEELCLYIEDMT